MLLAPWVAWAGCAAPHAGGAGREGFTKVKDYRLEEDDSLLGSGADPMIPFERKHLLYGAVTKEEIRARTGHYYTFFWRARPGSGPVVLRFEFQQANTAGDVRTLEQRIENPETRNETAVRVVGEPYVKDGRVVAWRASLLRGGEVLDTRQSFLWESAVVSGAAGGGGGG